MAEWISAICAALSLLGAGIAWYRSNLSAKAKQQAEEARKKAEEQAQLAKRQVEAAEEQADAAKEQAAELSQQVAELREMRTLFQGPPLEMFLIGENRWHLANKRDERVVIEEIVNADDFIRLRFGTHLGTYLGTRPVRSDRGGVCGSFGQAHPSNADIACQLSSRSSSRANSEGVNVWSAKYALATASAAAIKAKDQAYVMAGRSLFSGLFCSARFW